MLFDYVPNCRHQVYCTRLTDPPGTVNVAIEEHTDVLPKKGHRLIVSYSSCMCTSAELRGLGATTTRVSAFGGIASTAANEVAESRNQALTRAFRANLDYLVRSVEPRG